MASGARHQLARVAEVTYGVTPATPAFKLFRQKPMTGGLTRDSFESEELRADRAVTDLRLGVKKVAFEVPFELSYSSFDDELEGALGGTWTTNVLKMGLVRRSFTYERKFAEFASGDKPYARYKGSEVNTLSLQITNNAMVTGSLGFIAQDVALDTVGITGATYAAAPTTSPFDSFTGSLKEGGSTMAIATEIQLNLSNGLEQQFVLFSDVTAQPDQGRSRLTGQLGLRFTSHAYFEKFMNETESSLEFTLTDKAGNDLTFLVPRIKYTGGNPDIKGEGTIPLVLPFTALFDSTTNNSNLVITRAAA